MSGISEQNIDLQTLSNKLEATFERIYHERMTDIPIVNDKIGVHAVGFQHWQQFYLGVMVTPWFMNLTLFPVNSEDWKDKPELSTSIYAFPSGRYKFLTGFEPEIGKYQTCSLFSPMFEFADNAAAIETAEFILKELMNDENIEQGDIDTEQIEKIWHGEQSNPEEHSEHPEETDQTTPKEKLSSPISRRQLLRGTLMMGDEKHE